MLVTSQVATLVVMIRLVVTREIGGRILLIGNMAAAGRGLGDEENMGTKKERIILDLEGSRAMEESIRYNSDLRDQADSIPFPPLFVNTSNSLGYNYQ